MPTSRHTVHVCRKCTIGRAERLISILHRQAKLEYCRKQGENRSGANSAKTREREKARKLVLLGTCDNGHICEAFVIMMQCEELGGRERGDCLMGCVSIERVEEQ